MYAPTPVTVTAQRIAAQQLGDYKLYALPEPTSVAAQQTKQVQFIEQPSVSFERIYQYTIDNDVEPNDLPARASVIVRLQNKSDHGLGLPLPAGGVSIFEPTNDGTAVFAGQDSIKDVAEGLPVEVEMGRALDIRIVPRLAESVSSGNGRDKRAKDSWEIALENDKLNAVTFEFRQGLYGGEAQILSESDSHTDRFGRAVWTIPLASGQRVYLRYTVQHPT